MEIKNYKPIPNGGALKATFTLCMKTEKGIGEVDCQYFAKDTGSKWINFAGKEYTNRDGRKKNWNQARWPSMNFEQLTHEVVNLVETHLPQVDELPPF